MNKREIQDHLQKNFDVDLPQLFKDVGDDINLQSGYISGAAVIWAALPDKEGLQPPETLEIFLRERHQDYFIPFFQLKEYKFWNSSDYPVKYRQFSRIKGPQRFIKIIVEKVGYHFLPPATLIQYPFQTGIPMVKAKSCEYLKQGIVVYDDSFPGIGQFLGQSWHYDSEMIYPIILPLRIVKRFKGFCSKMDPVEAMSFLNKYHIRDYRQFFREEFSTLKNRWLKQKLTQTNLAASKEQGIENILNLGIADSKTTLWHNFKSNGFWFGDNREKVRRDYYLVL